jgi:UDP-N-acetylglucosamine 2-epimerase (non-hydrolysing)
MKVAPVMHAVAKVGDLEQILIHTGQHYDSNMSDVFFRQLSIPEPALNLGVGSGSHARQTARMMEELEKVVLERRPDLVMVYGDVNSTVAAALVCAKLGTRIGHVEAGLRSFDRTMPEEINRLLTDRVSDLLFTPSDDGDENLFREGVGTDRIHCVGNVMIDTLARLLPLTDNGRTPAVADMPPSGTPYALVTLHRPSNVDDSRILAGIMDALTDISRRITVVFPVHPRTRQRIRESGIGFRVSGSDFEPRILNPDPGSLILTDPVGYLEFLGLQRRAALVITDSGGIQEETTWLGIPCLTVRENTERPVTVTLGTNILVGCDMQRLRTEVNRILAGAGKRGQVPPLWDGHAAERIAEVIEEEIE